MSPPKTPTKPKAASSLLPRLITGSVIATIAVSLILTVAPDVGFFIWLAVFFWAATEFINLAQHLAPTAPLRGLWLWIPAAATAGFICLRSTAITIEPMAVVGVGFALTIIASLSCLLKSSVEARDAVIGMGLITFAIPYFAVPPVAIYWLHGIDRWLVFLMLAIVAVGDSLAYFAGRAFGRHPLAPRVSPKKTWEGSAAGFIGGLLATGIWCQIRLGHVPLSMLALTAVTAIVAQLGDLIESVIKRGVGVKDSSQILPGHGGFYDRLDAMLLAAPTFCVGLWLLGTEVLHSP